MLRKLLGGRKGGSRTDDSEAEVAARETYKGFELQAAPVAEGPVWRVAGSIQPSVSGEDTPQTFVRAETFANHETAVAESLQKARRLVDEQEQPAGPD